MNNFHVPLVPGGPGASAVQGVCIFSVIGVLLGGVLGAAATIDIQSTAIIAIAGGGIWRNSRVVSRRRFAKPGFGARMDRHWLCCSIGTCDYGCRFNSQVLRA
jgi:hypothetical protein